MFRSDLPIKSSNEDLLSRSGFSIALAEAILAYSNKESIVTALYGAWGAGKSSVVNLVLERVDKDPIDSRPILVKFNPWNYSDQNQLVEQFFRSISAALHSCSGVAPRICASPAAAMAQAEPTSPWQPTSAPEIEALILHNMPIAAALNK